MTKCVISTSIQKTTDQQHHILTIKSVSDLKRAGAKKKPTVKSLREEVKH